MTNRKKIAPSFSSIAVGAMFSLLAFPIMVHGADKPIYWIGSDGKFVKNPYGNCVRTIDWKAELALPECEPGMKQPEKVAAVPDSASASALEAAPAPVVKAVPEPAVKKITLTSDTLFDFNKADLRLEGKSKLNELAAKIGGKNISVEQILITGHASAPGTVAYNQILSERRAETVKSYLVQQGVDVSRVITKGVGESQPVASNGNAAGRALNRRVEIEIKAQQTVTTSN